MSKIAREFSMDRFLEECRAALDDDSPQRVVQELLARAVSEPSPLIRALGEPISAGIQKLHHSKDLTVLNVIWAPSITLRPHDHRMWAIIGVYEGREDNIFWRRLPEDAKQGIEAAGAKSLNPREAVPLGRDIIHSVNNPTSRNTGAIHVYGGDFFAEGRSEWDPETLVEQPFDFERNIKHLEEFGDR